jgi:hypothetical protein
MLTLTAVQLRVAFQENNVMSKAPSAVGAAGAALIFSSVFAFPAVAAHNNDAPFANRGQCQSTKMQLRNDFRRSGNMMMADRLDRGECRRISEFDENDSDLMGVDTSDESKFAIDLD